jgi:hypothetical protein
VISAQSERGRETYPLPWESGAISRGDGQTLVLRATAEPEPVRPSAGHILNHPGSHLVPAPQARPEVMKLFLGVDTVQSNRTNAPPEIIAPATDGDGRQRSRTSRSYEKLGRSLHVHQLG